MKEKPVEWFKRIRTACAIIEKAIEKAIDDGVTDLKDLDVEGLLKDADDYTKKVAGMLQPDTVDAALKPKNRNVTLKFVKAYGEYMDFVLDGIEKGKKLVYHYFETVPQVLLAMDMIPVCVETLPVLMAAIFNDGCEEEIDALEAEGFPAHLCSAQKGFVGAYLLDRVPAPDYFFKPSVPCDPSNLLFQYMSKLTGAPYIIFDVPYYTNERAFRYYKEELDDAYQRLMKLSGSSLDEEKLKRHVELTNKQLEYIYKIEDVRKNRPCPDPGFHRPMDFALYTIFGFSEKVVDYFKTVYEEAKERVEKGISIIPEGKDEIRTIWTWAFEGFDLSIYHWMEEEYGATYLICGLTILPEEFVGYIDTHDLDSMFEGLARLTFHYPMSRQTTSFADTWINDFVKAAKLYKADCAIFSGHMACKHGWALNKLLSDAIREEAGIPTLRFEMDIADKRFTPPGEVKRMLSEFFETIRH